jgi:PAS domain S-box-containing protein
MYAVRSQVKILIVDDEEEDFGLTRDLLRCIPGAIDWTIDWCFKYKEAIKIIEKKEYDIYFIDYFLGARTGLDLLRQAITNQCYDPIILLTGKGNHEIDMEAMRSGAMDYLVKAELNSEKLERSIRYALEKAQTLKELKISEQKFRAIFEQSKDAVFLMNEEFRFTVVNDATKSLLSFDKDQIFDVSLTDLINDELLAFQIIDRLQVDREVRDFELELTDNDGIEKVCIFSASAIKGIDEKSSFQGILHDITGMRSEEKSSLLTEKFALTGRLVQTLAHEIRNPLTNISLSVDHLQRAEKVIGQDRYFEIIERNSLRIDKLISQLLHVSKPSQISLQPSLIHQVIDDAIHAATDRIMLKSVKLQLRYPKEPLYILADRDQLSIALLNMIINSIEAMEEKEGRLIISVNQLDGECEIRITDNGTGISETDQKKLFEPYFTSKRNGIGLGLSTALNILQRHHATVNVVSLPGTGSTFSIHIPQHLQIP